MALLASALDAIGNTPLVALDRLHPGPGRLLAKMEQTNPGGSVKDRAAKRIVERAYETGRLERGQAVVEMTSGNMGAGLAVVCALTGNPFVAVMSAGNSPQRAAMMRALGAEVLLVPQVDGLPGQVTGRDVEAAAARAREIARQRGGFYVDQFRDPDGPLAHEVGTGPEIWRAAGGRLDVFVAVVGTAGTFVGVARALRPKGVRCLAVEPAGAEVLAGRPLAKPAHILQGAGYGIVPPLWDPGLADGFLAVTDDEARRACALLGAKEGLHVGWSSGANVAAAAKAIDALGLGHDALVATILCDTGLKY